MTIKEFSKAYGFEATKDVVRYEEIELYSEKVTGDYDITFYEAHAVLNSVKRTIEIEYRCGEFDIVTDDEDDMIEYILEYLM